MELNGSYRSYLSTSGLHSSASVWRRLAQLGRLGEDAVDVGREIVVRHQALAPAGEQDDRHGRRRFLHGGSDAAAVDIGHAEIGDDGGIRLAPLLRGAEGIDRLLAAAGLGHHVAVGLQQIAERFQEQRIVVHQQQAQAFGRSLGARGGVVATGTSGATGTGKISETVVPRPCTLRMSISAPWRRTTP